LTQLACLHEFLDKRDVWVFELRLHGSEWEAASGNRRTAILTRMSDFADLWGPVYAVPGPRDSEAIRQYNVSKGIICKVKGGTQPTFRNAVKCHWYGRLSWMRGLARKLLPPSEDSYLLPDELLLISGDEHIMVEKPACHYGLDHFEDDYGNLLNELGTKDSAWRWDTRGASFGFSKIVGVSITGTQKRIPDTSLKEKVLDKWQNAPERRNPQVLNQNLGVEVSHCTGNARRVAVRTLLTLKPMTLALERQFPGWRDRPWGGPFWDAVSGHSDAAVEAVWKTFEEHRAQMAQLVCFALDLLSPTGLEESKLSVAFLNNGQESSVSLDVKMNTWALLLKDTPVTASFTIINERCLLCRVPDHSAAGCSSSGSEEALTTLQSQIAVPASSGPAWNRVLVKSVGESFRRVDLGSASVVLLAAESALQRIPLFTRDTAVEGVELRNRAFRWGEKTAVYIQASAPSHGGMACARTPAVAFPAGENRSELFVPSALTTSANSAESYLRAGNVLRAMESLTPTESDLSRLSIALGPEVKLPPSGQLPIAANFLLRTEDNSWRREFVGHGDGVKAVLGPGHGVVQPQTNAIGVQKKGGSFQRILDRFKRTVR